MGSRGFPPKRLDDKWRAGPKQTKRNPVPKMPPDLEYAAQDVWRAMVPKIAKQRKLGPLDIPALSDLCRCIVRLGEAERQIEECGVLVPGDRGMVKNPAIQVAREYRTALVKWSQKFGLTPGDRERLSEPEEEPARRLWPQPASVSEPTKPVDDPRAALRIV